MTGALTRLESWRLLRHPFVLAGALLSGWLLWDRLGAQLPVLHVLDLATQAALVPLAGATLVAANLATLRPKRDHTEDLYATTPAPPAPRVAAHLLALLPVTAVAAALVAAVTLRAAGSDYAAGAPSLAELALGPAMVLLAGTLGVALGRVAPFAVAGPLALVAGLLVTMVVFVLGPAISPRLVWLTWLVPDMRPDAPPSGAVLGRPAGWHLTYVVAMVAGLGALALVRVGARRWGLATLVAAVAVGIVAGAAQVVTAPGGAVGDRRVAAAEAGLTRTCAVHEAVTYCAYAGFENRVPLWRDVVRRARDRVPATAAVVPLEVSQQAQHWDPASAMVGYDADIPAGGPVPVPVGWPTGDGAGAERLRLGIRVAQRTMALPALDLRDLHGCRPAAGGGVALWLAAVADPGAVAALRSDLKDIRDAGAGTLYVHGAHSSLADFDWTRAEAEQAVALLDRPEADVRRLVADHWAVLTAPGGTLAQASGVLGIPGPTC
ncbi:hypothetical protein R8Z50_20550 [Longispora sp. K20-0274]|uniref:hypothetical protein n=1 Tax=Longispora sp. K20-0274 TaxID=3088255 RepID=UPI00399AC477